MESKKLVLALNAGSSSLKASVIRNQNEAVVTFLAERLSTPDAAIHIHQAGRPSVEVEKESPTTIFSHAQALSQIIACLQTEGMLQDLVTVGHRVVHGGTLFSDSALDNDHVLEQIKSVSHLAPL